MTRQLDSGMRLKGSAFTRFAPPLVFLLAVFILVICCYDSGYSGLPPTEKRYTAAKKEIKNLRQDAKKNNLREPWEKLAQEFKSIYDDDPAWPNRPAALFRAAESLEELSVRSCSKSDARKAINCYETVALRHAASRLADDALFRAARLRAASLRDDKGALSLLERLKKQYPQGDMISEAIALERAIKASASGKTAPEALKAANRPIREAQEDQPADKKRLVSENFAGDLPLRYKSAKARMTALRNDSIKACWRQPWEDLREEFLKIGKSGKKSLAPQALFNAAVCQRELAVCSRVSSDARKAANYYIAVAKQHPEDSLADDALLQAARLLVGVPGGRKEADELLERIIQEYPRGDMRAEARRLRSIWADSKRAAAVNVASKAPVKPELQVLSWNTISKNSVEIALEMSAPVKYSARLVNGSGRAPARLTLDLDNASVVEDVRKGVKVQGSLLKAVSVNQRKNGGASLAFDFSEVRKFDVRAETHPCRIILSVAAGKAALPLAKPTKTSGVAQGGDNKKATGVKAGPEKARIAKAAQISMASQLGLTVHRVFIDAGHGGKDPGTSHNSIMERVITLDIAKNLGRLLKANGLEVIFSRTADKYVPLSERTRMANNAKADLFISIHVNANDNPAINGLETYYLALASTPQAARVAMLENTGSDRHLSDMHKMLADVMLNARVDESKRLAGDIQKASIFRLKKNEHKVRDNGVKSAPFHVLLGARMPAALVEIGYCTNSAEAARLANPHYRQLLAEGLAEGVMAYRNRLLNNRTANAVPKKQRGAI